jgi:ribosomal 50S subunit-recycling heat shock protein
MRVDLFLKLMGTVKTRMAAKRLCDQGHVLVDGKTVKPSQELTVGNLLLIQLPLKELKGRVLAVPSTKSVAKKDRSLYFQVDEAPER